MAQIQIDLVEDPEIDPPVEYTGPDPFEGMNEIIETPVNVILTASVGLVYNPRWMADYFLLFVKDDSVSHGDPIEACGA